MDKHPLAADPLQPLCLLDNNDHITYASSLLSLEELKVLEGVLQQNKDFFAWAHFDMLNIHPSIASYQLNISPSMRLIRQKVRCFHLDGQKIIQAEVDKLLAAGFIMEVEYSKWLANFVVIPKKEGRWRVCVDYTNLNDACLKDSFPLSRINQIVDSTTGHRMLSFIDAFSDYH